MKGNTLPLIVGVFVLLLCADVSAESTPLTSISVVCPNDGPHFVIWIEGDEGTCKETLPGLYECWEIGNDYAGADCGFGCVETHIENVAGCRSKDSSPGGPVPEPLFTVECENDRRYELKGVAGDACSQNDEGTNGNHNVTGGQCQHEVNGEMQTSTSVDCETGCGPTQVPADCKRTK